MDKIFSYFIDLFKTAVFGSISELSFLDILVCVLALLIVFGILKGVWFCLKHLFKGLGHLALTPKKKCAKIACPKCGRPLTDCICSSNKDASYGKRLRNYKKYKKEEKKANKKK